MNSNAKELHDVQGQSIQGKCVQKNKKGIESVASDDVYRFLNSSNPTMAIASMMATVEATKYISVGGNFMVSAIGDGVGASSTTKAVSAVEP